MSNMSSQLEYTTATTDADLEQILALQRPNRREHLTAQEMQAQGFLSARHNLGLLQAMNTPHRHVIVKNEQGRVVGYTLCLLRTFDANLIPILDGLNQVIEQAMYQGQSVAQRNYVIMGQVCIDKEYRGHGVFAGLYAKMRQTLATQFDCIVTSISSRNPRSLRAHQKVGFQKVHAYSSHGQDWQIVLWEWKGDE